MMRNLCLSTSIRAGGAPAIHRRVVLLALVTWTILVGEATPARALPSIALTLAVTAAGSPVTTASSGTAVTLTATASSGTTAVTVGQVDFCDASAQYCTDIHLLATAQLTTAGTATLKFIPGSGTHSYKALFRGTSTYAASSSSVAVLVVVAPAGPVNTTVGIQASGGAGNYSLLATVATNGSLSPTGQVSYLDTDNANYVLGTALLGPTGSNGISFRTTTTFPLPRQGNIVGSYAVTADFNQDGIPDLLVTDPSYGTISILLGNGDGTFSTTILPSPTGYESGSLVVGDFNADGKMDFALNLDGGPIAIYLGNGDGTFTAGQHINPTIGGGSTGNLVVADFNGDGVPDIAETVDESAAGGIGGNCFNGFRNCFVQIFSGHGDGTFAALPNLTPSTHAFSMVTADFNGDGKPDLALTSIVDGYLLVLLGNGDGTFVAAPHLLPNTQALGLAAADLNGDGNPDLVVVSQGGGNSTFVLLGHGDGTFTTLPDNVALDQPTTAIAFGDFNGDGIPDLVLPNENGGYTSLFVGKGDGTFVADAFSPSVADFNFFSIVVGDFNGDGQSDIAEAMIDDRGLTIAQDQLSVFLAQAPNTAAAYVYDIQPVGTGLHYVDASYPGDSNNAAGLSNTVPLVAEQVTTTLALAASPTGSSSVGQPVMLTATLNKFLAQDHSASGTITFTTGATILGTASVSNGVATLTTTALAAGADRLQAVYAGDVNFTSSTSPLISYTVDAMSQTIAFPQPATPAYADTSVTLAATATSGLPVTYTVVSGPATVSGSSLSFRGAGTAVVAADQSGNGNFSPAPEVTRTIVVNTHPDALVLTATPNPAFLQNPVLVTAVITPIGATTGGFSPTGTITFFDAGVSIGAYTVAGTVTSLSVSTLAVGTHSITAIYSGDSNFASASSPPITVTVEDFSLAFNNTQVTISHGGTATYSLILTSLGGGTTASTVSLSIAGAPDTSRITFTPQSVPAGSGSSSITLVIQTPNYPVGPWQARNAHGTTGLSVACVAICALLFPFGYRKTHRPGRRCHPWPLLLFAAASIALFALTACGSGWKTQQWTINVTATSGQLSRTASALLISE
jgi:hypothetical protein